MKDSTFLYQIAERKNIPVIPFPLPESGSLCIQGDGGECYIGIDERFLETESEKKVHLGHELGHCMTGSFYNRYAPCDIREKHEIRADKWAINRLIPLEDLEAAVAAGYTDIWELAEYFNVTEDFMRKAICWHKNGNLCTDHYS